MEKKAKRGCQMWTELTIARVKKGRDRFSG